MTDIRVYGEEGPTCGVCGTPALMPDDVDPMEPWEALCQECGTENCYQDEEGDPDFADMQELNFDD